MGLYAHLRAGRPGLCCFPRSGSWTAWDREPAGGRAEGNQHANPSGRGAQGRSGVSAGAMPDGPDGIAPGLRHRASPGSPQCPLQPAGDIGASPEATDSSPTDRTIVLRLKFLNDTERLATVCPEETVGSLKRAHFPGQEHQVRLIYQGQLLRDDAQSLAALHLTHNSVLHCHVSQHGPAPVAAGLRATADPVHTALSVGSLMLPLFALMLAVLWYVQLQYQHVFTATATSCLAGLTLLFSFMAFALYRR
ncbi:unnamed protein product [Eretmochelys imbricata]